MARQWDRSLFQRAKAELLALLGSSAPITVEVLASVMNLQLFVSIFKGHTSLGRQLLTLARKMAASMGLVADADTMEPPANLLGWQKTMQVTFGGDPRTRPMSREEIARVRELWIDYWVGERVVQLIGVFFSLQR